MITTEKIWPEYTTTCSNCGQEIEFTSNQKAGTLERFICECYHIGGGVLDHGEHKYLMNRDEETTDLRRDVFRKFSELQMSVTVRQMYYQLLSEGYPKTEAFYGRVQRELLYMRQQGVLPYSFIIDNSRRRIKYQSYGTGAQALDNWMRHYKQDVWLSLPNYCEVWLEKKALQSIFDAVCYEYDVPLCVSSGFASESFVYEAVTQIKSVNKPTVIFYFSDYDPSGLALSKTVEDKIRRFGVKNFELHRVALTPAQISQYNLVTRPTKQSNHSRGFKGDSCELDAIHPHELVKLIRRSILSQIPDHHMRNIASEESVQRETLANMKLLMQA